MHDLIELLKHFDVANLLAIGIGAWVINRNLNRKIEAIHKEFEGIHKEFKFINIRVSRMEGTVYGKDFYKDLEIK